MAQLIEINQPWEPDNVFHFPQNIPLSLPPSALHPYEKDDIDIEEWERALMAEDDLAAAPAISLDAMRRENMYEDKD